MEVFYQCENFFNQAFQLSIARILLNFLPSPLDNLTHRCSTTLPCRIPRLKKSCRCSNFCLKNPFNEDLVLPQGRPVDRSWRMHFTSLKKSGAMMVLCVQRVDVCFPCLFSCSNDLVLNWRSLTASSDYVAIWFISWFHSVIVILQHWALSIHKTKLFTMHFWVFGLIQERHGKILDDDTFII